MTKLISILGATGSIGQSSLSVIEKKKNFFNIYLLSGNKNFKIINKQILKYKPYLYFISDLKTFQRVKKKFKKSKTKIINSFNEIKKKSDITISAIPGLNGLAPTVYMIKKSKKLLIANKESIICGWNIIKKKALTHNTKIVPVDSEHFSIFKLLENHKISEVKKIFITASGGPFFNYKAKDLKKIKAKDALKHPKWKMGKKISIDSSTLMNKILEIIEAQKLFNIPNKMVEIILHPNSLVHAMIQFKNGLTKLIYHETSMIIPLANAIFDGKLNIDEFYKKINHQEFENLIFSKVNSKIFPVIKLKNRLNEYPSTSIIINATNEILVDQFLKKKIPFMCFFKIIKTILNDRNYKKYAIKTPKNLDQIFLIDNWARNKTIEKIKSII